MRDRTIKYAFDKHTKKILDADKIFQNKPEGFEVRKENALNLYELTCLECEQKLTISASKYDRLHFKHLPNHDFCSLSELDLTPEDIDKFNRILIAKESDRHKELKNKIADRLSKIEGVEVPSIAIDNRFIIKERDRRRPDVYCKYFDKEIVFEIQLSDLSLRYILSRTEFYKKHGIFLVWILDNFNHEKHPFKRDIKYLTEYENFFKLDESASEFRFLCDYKYVFITEENKLLCKWMTKSLSISDVKFDSDYFQLYYYNYGKKWNELKARQKGKAEKVEEEKRKKIEQSRYFNAIQTVDQIIRDIYDLKKLSISFARVENKISGLDDYELCVFNERLNLKNREREGMPILNYWANSEKDPTFLIFILNCFQIELDVNRRDSKGTSVFRKFISWHTELMVGLFRRGYNLTNEDKDDIKLAYPNSFQREITIYELANNLINKDYVDSIFRHPNIFLTIQSAKMNQITGFAYAPNAWVAFANNAAEHYKEYWEYIELAFKKYGLWDNLLKSDKKGTFHEKLQKVYLENPVQSYDCDGAIKDLFWEIFV